MLVGLHLLCKLLVEGEEDVCFGGEGMVTSFDNPFQYGQCENYYRPALVNGITCNILKVIHTWRLLEITGDYWREHWKAWC